MHAVAEGKEYIVDTAAKIVSEKTGLNAKFRAIGSGYFHTLHGKDLEGFTNFTVLVCESAGGQLSPQDDNAEYFWEKEPDFSHPDMLPNMKLLSDAYQKGDFPFFIDGFVHL
jgi:hypothetical protein